MYLIFFIDKGLTAGLDIGPILLTDYYHPDYYTIVEGVMSHNPLDLVCLQISHPVERLTDVYRHLPPTIISLTDETTLIVLQWPSEIPHHAIATQASVVLSSRRGSRIVSD